MEFENLSLRFASEATGSIQILAACRLAGEAEGRCDLRQLHALADRSADAAELYCASRKLRPLGDAFHTAHGDDNAATLGAHLFRLVFSGVLRSLFDQCLGAVRGQSGLGLRIRVHLGLDDPALEVLHRLPWETLFLPEERRFLSRSRQTPVVRYLSLPCPPERPCSSSGLRILVLRGAQDGRATLNLQTEKEVLQRTLAGNARIEVEPVSLITLHELREALLARPAEGLHFMGHGFGSSSGGEGGLLLHGERGEAVAIRASQLAEELRDFLSLRWVVLNACETAAVHQPGAWSAVATALLRVGIPSVVAMQFPITDAAALEFSRCFYRRIAAGDPIDIAVTEARLALVRAWPDSTEWATPVVYLRASQGRLLSEAPAPRLEVGKRHPFLWLATAGLTASLTTAGLNVASGLRAGSPISETQRPVNGPPTASQEKAGKATVDPIGVNPTRDASGSGKGTSGAEHPSRSQPMPRSPPPQPTSHSLDDGQSTYLGVAEAEVAVTFRNEFGQDYLIVSISGRDADLVQEPLMGPADIGFTSAGLARKLTVLAIDWVQRRVTIRG